MKYRWYIEYDSSSQLWDLWIEPERTTPYTPVVYDTFDTKEAAVRYRDEYFQYLRDLKAYRAWANHEGEVEI